ncbi:MAG: M24 family metallopeptidase [Acidimicrobiales bacterium]
MNQDIVDKCVRAIAEADLDGLIAMSPENFGYVAGFIVPSQPILRWRHAAVVVTADGRTALFTVDMEASTVADLEPGSDIKVWEEFEDDAMPVLSRLLGDLGLGSGRIGLETDYIPARDLDRLSGLLPDARWEPAGAMFNRLRLIKTPRELELMRRLARITDQSIKDALESVKPGDTEMELAGAVTTGLFRLGADNFKWLILASGERSQFPNVGPTSRTLGPGDLVRLEVFGMLDGYHTGICRTAVVAAPDAEVTSIWSGIVECRDIIWDSIRPGASAAAIYGKVARRFADQGWEPMSFVGHGIGLFVHEEPYIGRYGDAAIEAGMVLGTEPVLLLPGRYGFQVKDIVAVGEDGCELLSDVTNTDQLFVIE